MGIFSDDIVKDILARVIEAAASNQGGFTDSIARTIEDQVRQDWGGSEPYIAHGEAERRARRDENINDLYWNQNQRDVVRLSSRFNLSVKQIRRIVGS